MNYPDDFSSKAFARYWGSHDRPGRAEVREWADRLTSDFIASATASFDKQFPDADFRPAEIDAVFIRQMLEEAAWDIVKRDEDDT